MPKLTSTEIKQKYDKTTSHKRQWRSIYEDAYRYALPMRNLYDGYYESAPGQDPVKVFCGRCLSRLKASKIFKTMI